MEEFHKVLTWTFNANGSHEAIGAFESASGGKRHKTMINYKRRQTVSSEYEQAKVLHLLSLIIINVTEHQVAVMTVVVVLVCRRQCGSHNGRKTKSKNCWQIQGTDGISGLHPLPAYPPHLQ